VNVANIAPGVPFGSFDTPANNATGIAGAVPVTGWALDNIEVSRVGIWREPVGAEPVQPNGLVFIGNATFVNGARPDVQNAFPNTPLNARAGWGYMLLTNFLPHSGGAGGSGNGTYRLHAIAVNKAGQSFELGIHSITVDNAHASRPFGTIDTPDQGGTVSGSSFVNFGWALTQNPNCIATDGSTMTVTVDGVTLGHPAYNNFRNDIATSFPGLCNSGGAIGFYILDTTKLSNGVHTIGWLVYDNVGHGDGIGSRFFMVANAGTGNEPAVDEPIQQAPDRSVRLRRGLETAEALPAAPDGVYAVELEELGLMELQVGAVAGYQVVGDERRPLPVGSTLKGGVFYWQAALGFLGEYQLVFERSDGSSVNARVIVQPRSYSTPR
jgi:hypothetical protein